MVQATQAKFQVKTDLLLQSIKADLTTLFREAKIRIAPVPEPVKDGFSVDILYSHKNRPEKAWFSLFFTIVLPKKDGQKEAETKTGMFLQSSYVYTIIGIELVLHDYDRNELDRENQALAKLVQKNQNRYRNF